MLLPAKFQTPTPAALGAKVVAMPAAPKPHVHQWVSVPDSKIHSRCAECGTVTLTEIVAPKMVAFADAMQAMIMASQKPTFAELCTTPAPAPEISNSALTAAARDFLNGSADHARAISHARSVLDEMGFKKVIDLPQHRRDEFLTALTTWPQEPTRHYTSVTAPDGRVRMVETDAEGWIKNDGTQPVADDVRVEVRFADTEYANMTYDAKAFVWRAVTHWRLAK